MRVRNTLPFAIVPEWLLDSEVSDRAVRLYGVLMRYADQEGHAHPTRRTLAKRLRCSVDTIDRAVAELVAAGALEVEHRDRDEGTGQTSNDYVLLPGGRTDAAPPLGTGAAPLNESQEELEIEKTSSSLLRKRNPQFDALAEIEGLNLTEIDNPTAGRIAVALSRIQRITPDLTPGEIIRRAENYPTHFSGATLTANALAKWWAKLGSPGKNGHQETTAERMARIDAERAKRQ